MTQDRRSAYRCSVQPNEQPAILRAGEEELSARLVEKSATGFGVIVDGPLDWELGQVVVLATIDGRCLARVVHSTDLESGEIRIGLERSKELPPEQKRVDDWGSLAPQTLASRARSFARLAAVFLACLVASTWAMSYVTSWWKGSDKDDEGKAVAKASAVSRPARPEARLANEFLRLDQLKSGDLVKKLNLSRDQQQKISGIVEQMTAALTALYETRRPNDPETWSELGLHVIQASWGKIDQELTPDQRAQWNVMLAEAETAATAADASEPPVKTAAQ